MKILLVDDDRPLLAALVRSLRLDRPDWEVVTAADGAEAMRVLRAGPVALLVTDIQMPGLDGLGLLAAVRRDPLLADLPLIFITAQDDRGSMRRGMSSGADDYLTKPFTAEELIQAIEGRLQRLERGEPALQARLQEELTERERTVLALIGKGLVTKEIAAAIGLSPMTVSVHRANIMRKLDLHNAAALAALAIRAGLSS